MPGARSAHLSATTLEIGAKYGNHEKIKRLKRGVFRLSIHPHTVEVAGSKSSAAQ
jgi:hypothetical protein